MARKNQTRENKSNKSKKKGFLHDERFKVTLGLILSGFGILLFISMVSYIFTWKTDQSFEWSKVISNPEFGVENWAGKVGAYFSNLLINKWFGISSFVLPFLLVLLGLKLMHVRIFYLFRIIRIGFTWIGGD